MQRLTSNINLTFSCTPSHFKCLAFDTGTIHDSLRFGSCFVVLFAQNMVESSAHACNIDAICTGLDFDWVNRVGDECDHLYTILRIHHDAFWGGSNLCAKMGNFGANLLYNHQSWLQKNQLQNTTPWHGSNIRRTGTACFTVRERVR